LQCVCFSWLRFWWSLLLATYLLPQQPWRWSAAVEDVISMDVDTWTRSAAPTVDVVSQRYEQQQAHQKTWLRVLSLSLVR
jgi:hypothetical protein